MEKWTHPKAKTSDCLEKGSWSSAVSGESWRTISGARWQSQPLGIRSLSSLLLQRERNSNKQNPFEPSKLNPFYFLSCIRVSKACANNLPKDLWGKRKLSSRETKLPSGVKVFFKYKLIFIFHILICFHLEMTLSIKGAIGRRDLLSCHEAINSCIHNHRTSVM